ncbi:MAG TPA: ATP-dependent DNA helicase [Micromonospora sp.]|nr:ATP-dependent DNA helicase [Micromonospora sp.]
MTQLSTRAASRVAAADAGPRYTPRELARLLGLHSPTGEQAAIIAAPVQPLLVVAGAGSGKTETMAARVLWLVANGYVRPDQILGLTFTRKAAGELAHRIRVRLSQLVRRLGREERHSESDLLGGEPTVATYHSYAARVVTEHGLRAGYEPTTRLLTEASRWQIVDLIVRNYTGDMSDVDRMPSTVTDAVLALAGELAEHLVTPDDVAAWTGRFFADVQSRPGKLYADVRKVLAVQQIRLRLLPLVRAYEQRKLGFEAMDFGDQMARAAQVARDHPEVGAIERDRYRVVLLDEYQDTSHAQVVLLRSLYGDGHPVTAVGDPCQSIYGWRGASAGTLDRFPTDFAHRGRPTRVLGLTTSWRNRPEILSVANRLATPLRAAGARVAPLVAAARVDAPIAWRATTGTRGRTVHCALLDTFETEAAWIADSVLAAWQARHRDVPPEHIPIDERPTTAVLVRLRSQIPAIEAALRDRGLPVEVVGLGGLLDTPEVRDVVSALRVLADPTDGASLLRLLTGPRWRIGPRDLVALHRRATAIALERRNLVRGYVSGEPEIIPDRLDEATLVEALADLGPAQTYSAEGYARLRGYGQELARLRYRLDQPLPDLIADIERTIGLDVEVAVRAGTGGRGGDAGLARGHLDALGDVAARFASDAENGAPLSAFLAYLAAAEDEERGLAPGEVEVTEGAVQILTAHAAKGLEWDIVAVAGLTRGVWPGPIRGGDHYLRGLGVLPFPLRGDRDGLPRLNLDAAENQKEVRDALDAFAEEWHAHHEREERRLAYVAVTRPRRLLLCSGYWWGENVKKPRGPSVFLRELQESCLAGDGVVDVWTSEPAGDTLNPTTEMVLRAEWPADPLGIRRPVIAEAAALVRKLMVDGLEAAVGPPPPAGDSVEDGRAYDEEEAARWRQEVDLLLAERERLAYRHGPVEVTLPGQMSVSQLVALRRDPAALARTLRRPMPTRPDPYARRGTAFHAWLEQRYGGGRLLDLDELPGAADEDAAPDEALAELQDRFLASEWADRTPVEVEVPFATVIAGVVVRGRMDSVFRDVTGRYDVIDWKTGRRPSGTEADAAAVQLAAYRLAWAELAGVPVRQVRAGFHYVRDGVTVRPADLLDATGLTALVAGLPEPAR